MLEIDEKHVRDAILSSLLNISVYKWMSFFLFYILTLALFYNKEEKIKSQIPAIDTIDK